VISAVLLTGVSFCTLSALGLLLLPARLAGFWVGDDNPESREVLQNAVTFLYFAAAFQMLDGAQVIANSLLRALQDTFMPMLLAGACYWLLGFPAALSLSFLTALGGSGVWLAYTLALLAAAIALWARFLWKLRQVQHSGKCALSRV
jgi:MATE family multidrug resistance protein